MAARIQPHGLAFAPIKVGVLIDIDMGTIAVCQKCAAGARSRKLSTVMGHAAVMRETS